MRFKNKPALGISNLKLFLDKLEFMRNKGLNKGVVFEHHMNGGYHIGDHRFTKFKNADLTIDSIIRGDIHARGLDLTKDKGNSGSDLIHPATVALMNSLGRPMSSITKKDFNKNNPNQLHCEHIDEILQTRNDLINSYKPSNDEIWLADFLLPRTATVTIPKSYQLIKGKQGFDRYPDKPELNGKPIYDRNQLFNERTKDKSNKIIQQFNELKKLSSSDWKTLYDQNENKNKNKPPKHTKFPDLNDQNNLKIIKRNDPLEITKTFFPNHFKPKRYLKEAYRSQKTQIASQLGFDWYK